VGAAVAACAHGFASLLSRGNALSAPSVGAPTWPWPVAPGRHWLPLVERECPCEMVGAGTGACVGAVALSGVLPETSGVRLPAPESEREL